MRPPEADTSAQGAGWGGGRGALSAREGTHAHIFYSFPRDSNLRRTSVTYVRENHNCGKIEGPVECRVSPFRPEKELRTARISVREMRRCVRAHHWNAAEIII